MILKEDPDLQFCLAELMDTSYNIKFPCREAGHINWSFHCPCISGWPSGEDGNLHPAKPQPGTAVR